MLGPASVALAADLLLGEPPERLHPTVWMGRLLAAGRSLRQAHRPLPSLLEGSLLLGGGAAIAAAIAMAAGKALGCAPRGPTRAGLGGAALKPALSLRALLEAALDVEYSLEHGRLSVARRTLARHLVSRNTTELSPAEVAGAAIESVAENLSDSVVAPLLAFRVGGLAAAYVYRMINTADAMLGYRTAELEWFGKAAARADDVVNIVPARVTAALICCAAGFGRGSSRRALSTALADAGRTSSPNAGWPMAAMAGALGVTLTKRGDYVLNRCGRAPAAHDIGRSCRIAMAASLLGATLFDSV